MDRHSEQRWIRSAIRRGKVRILQDEAECDRYGLNAARFAELTEREKLLAWLRYGLEFSCCDAAAALDLSAAEASDLIAQSQLWKFRAEVAGMRTCAPLSLRARLDEIVRMNDARGGETRCSKVTRGGSADACGRRRAIMGIGMNQVWHGNCGTYRR